MNEFKTYCTADVEVLSKTVLAFRHIFRYGLDIDPYPICIYTTLGSLCINLFSSSFMPGKMLVNNENNKNDSRA